MEATVFNEERVNGVVLASGSPRRKELLGQIVDTFEIIVSGVPEPVDSGLSPAQNVLSIASAKADAIVPIAGGRIVLAADTDVVLDGEILGKPYDAADAESMLRRLRGKDHEVLTAVVVVDPDREHRLSAVVRSLVRIRNLSDDEIAAYVATREPLDKAGGYAIQGEAASMVQSVDGCYTNVVGLPVCATIELLSFAGVQVRDDATCQNAAGDQCPRVNT